MPLERVQLVKHGIDLELQIKDSQGTELYRIADWRGREGWLTALLEQDKAKEYLLEVSAVEKAASPGQYTLQLDDLPLSDPGANIRIDAERLMSQADQERYSHYLGTGGSREHAFELFQTARGLWNQIGLPREEARALFSIAAIQQELGQKSAAHQTYQQALNLWRKVGDERGIAISLNQLGLIDQELGQQSEALDHLGEARALREKLGDTYFLAQTANNMGLIYTALGDSRVALKYLLQALEAHQGEAEFQVPIEILRQDDYFQAQVAKLRNGGDLYSAAIVLNNLARVHHTLGEYGEALNDYESFRFISEYLGNAEDVALATLNIGQAYFQMAELQQALDHLSQALEFFSGPDGNPYWHSLALDNLGKVYLQLGDNRRALDFFERALALRTREDNPKGRADTLQRMGETYAALGEPAVAIDYFKQSLELRRTAVGRYREALTLDQLGLAQADLGRFDDALKSHLAALEIHREAGNIRGQIESLVNLGRFYASRSQPQEATVSLQQALVLARDTGDRVWEAQDLFELAKIESAQGQTKVSLEHLDESLTLIDSLRGDLISPELRASFFATQLEVHHFYVDELMTLAQSGDPSKTEEAFVVSERGRQRTLLDYLANTGSTAANSDIDLLKRREELQRELDANQQERIRIANNPAINGQLAAIDMKIRDVTAELEKADIAISGLRAPGQELEERAVSVAQIAPLLGDDTLLLEYALGEERSFVWLIGKSVFEYAILPSAKDIDTRVREAFAKLRTNSPSDAASERDQLGQLGELLLGPLAQLLGEKRLAIVPDGVLHYLPFNALGDPRFSTEPRPLAITNEIVMLPSASALLGLRERILADDESVYRIAVLADPVFTADDPRVVAANEVAFVAPRAERSLEAEGSGLAEFTRLSGTLKEAEFIQELAGPGHALVLTGFEANRAQLTSGSLDEYNVLHLATHGIVNPAYPGLSGVILSVVDSSGHPQSPFVRALDLFYMRTGARLVVLSACETALGKEIRGEGLMGLTRGFFYAGADTVISSLWQVPDRATSELMRRFYVELLQNSQPPATALRLAQLGIREQRKWRDPYYWAAFTVQGDWKWSVTSDDGAQLTQQSRPD